MDFMAWDLWGSSYDEAPQDSGWHVLPGWQCDFYVGFGDGISSPNHFQDFDCCASDGGILIVGSILATIRKDNMLPINVIEEDALNEKSCVQVLRILITSADTEIDELEKELATLQNELAWAECEEWSEICCTTLREKINCLDTSLKSLRNTERCEIDVQLLMHRGPAEGVHEIVKALIQNHSLKKDEQPPDVLVKDSSSDAAPALAGSDVMVKEEVEEAVVTSSEPEESPVSRLLKFQKEKTNPLEAVKPVNTTANDDVSVPLLLASGYSEEKKLSYKSNSKHKTKNKAKSEGSAHKGNKMNPRMKPSDSKVKRSRSNALKYTGGSSKSNKKLSVSDRQKVSKKVEEPTVNAVNLDSSFKPKEGETGLLKHGNVVGESGIEIPAYAADNSHEMRKVSNLDLEVKKPCSTLFKSEKLNLTSPSSDGKGVDGDEKVKKPCSAMKKRENLNSTSPSSDGKGYLAKTEMVMLPCVEQCTNAIKGSGAYATGNSHEVMKTLCSSGLEVDGDKKNTKQYSETTKSENLSSSLCCSEGNGHIIPNAETLAKIFVQCNDVHASRYAADNSGRKQGSEPGSGAFTLSVSGKPDVEQIPTDTKDGTEVFLTNKINLISSLETKGNISETQKVPETGIGNSGQQHSGLTSPFKLQLKMQFAEGTLPVQTHKAEIVANDSKSNLNVPMKPQVKKAKRKIQLNMVQEASNLPTGVGSNSPVSKVKRRKLVKSDDNVCLNQLLGRLKKPVPPIQQDRREFNAIVPTEKSSSVPILIEFKTSTVDMNISDSLGGGTERASKGGTPCPTDGSKVKASTVFELSEMKLVDLKAIARHYNLQQYSKLRKDQLVKQLTEALSS